MGPSVRTAEAGIYRGDRAAAAAGAVLADSRTRNDAARREVDERLHSRAVHEGPVKSREGRHRLLAAAQRFLDGVDRFDGNGRPGVVDRVRERRQSADCPWVHAPARNRGAIVAWRNPRSTGPAAPHRKRAAVAHRGDRKSTRLNSSHSQISYAVFCLKKKKKN